MGSDKQQGSGFFRIDIFAAIAISSLIFLTVAFSRVVGSVAIVFVPLPILYYRAKCGPLEGLVIFGGALLVACVVAKRFNPVMNPLVLLVPGFLGFGLWELLKRGLSIERTVSYAVSMLAGFGILVFLFRYLGTEETPWQLVEGYIAASLQEGIQSYTRLGIPAEQVAAIKEKAGQITRSMTYIFPGLVLVGAASTVWINLLAARMLFQIRDIPFPDFGDLAQWKAPEGLVWILIAAGGSLLLPLEWMKFTGLNILIVCFFVYLLQGLSIISFFFRRKGVPTGIRAVVYIFIVLQQYLVLPVILVGLFDLWIDFRKYIKPSKGVLT
ncbi:MAG: YybS family protein [Deltaproteobacteria bacterium]|nr:YybS family protein [Deltaproteobacteria bacterium]